MTGRARKLAPSGLPLVVMVWGTNSSGERESCRSEKLPKDSKYYFVYLFPENYCCYLIIYIAAEVRKWFITTWSNSFWFVRVFASGVWLELPARFGASSGESLMNALSRASSVKETDFAVMHVTSIRARVAAFNLRTIEDKLIWIYDLLNSRRESNSLWKERR